MLRSSQKLTELVRDTGPKQLESTTRARRMACVAADLERRVLGGQCFRLCDDRSRVILLQSVTTDGFHAPSERLEESLAPRHTQNLPPQILPILTQQ